MSFTYCHMAISIFCLNLSCHATMNIWINCINNKELWQLTRESRRHPVFFISNKRGQYYISVILMYLLFWYFYKIWWKARIYTCKNEQLLFWINRDTFTKRVSDWIVSYLLDSKKNIIWAREIHRVVKNQVKYFQKS